MSANWREPSSIVAGDTLAFSRKLSDYSAADGWSLSYTARAEAQSITFTSTADGVAHVINVDAATTAGWLPGEYVLVGYVVKGGERHQVYEGDLTIESNPQTEPTQAKTFAQQMVENLEAVMLGKAGDDVLESRIGETQFKFLSPQELRTEHGYWLSVRNQELAMNRARAGRPTGRKIRPLVRVVNQQPSVGMFGRGSGYGGW